MGWPIEFLNLNEIRSSYGIEGKTSLTAYNSKKAEITDDTQMVLFKTEGIICSETKKSNKKTSKTVDMVYKSYLRWLYTQGYGNPEASHDAWLVGIEELHRQRSPGSSCISALLNPKQGSIKDPINNSKGCGGVIRVSPAGLFYGQKTAFDSAAEFAALAHGHPTGYLAAGSLASIISRIIEGEDIETSIENTLSELKKRPSHQECAQSLYLALKLNDKGISDIDAISKIGEGWTGEEALAIAVFCSLKHRDDIRNALISAVNHDGDSDSTGAITGNILGAYKGLDAIPEEWVKNIELSDILFQVADDLLLGCKNDDKWLKRYPVT